MPYVPIYGDSHGAIFNTQNPVMQKGIKHIEIHYHYIWEQIKKVVFGSPVWSGLLVPSALDRNHNRSSQFEKLQKLRPNCNRPVFCGLLRLQDRF